MKIVILCIISQETYSTMIIEEFFMRTAFFKTFLTPLIIAIKVIGEINVSSFYRVSWAKIDTRVKRGRLSKYKP